MEAVQYQQYQCFESIGLSTVDVDRVAANAIVENCNLLGYMVMVGCLRKPHKTPPCSCCAPACKKPHKQQQQPSTNEASSAVVPLWWNHKC